MNFAIAAPPLTTAATLGASAVGQSGVSGTPEHRKLMDAAQQFEGMLLQEMLKPMREHGFGQQDEEDKSEGSGFGDTLSSFGTEAMATAIAKGGGLGIAKRVVAQVEGEKKSHDSQAAQAAPVKAA